MNNYRSRTLQTSTASHHPYQQLIRLLCALIFLMFTFASMLAAEARQQEIVIDSIVASVDNTPITLRDLCNRLTPKRDLSIDQASQDPEALYALDVLILEELVRQEAKSRRISTSDSEVDAYISEVAGRNAMSREEFEKALADEGKSLDLYRQQVEIDILKSKLSSNLLKSGSGVTDSEVKDYIKEHPELTKSGAKVKLSQIFVARNGRSEKEAKDLMDLVSKKLDNGEDFEQLARTYSESPEGAEGGSLGVLAEEDLSRDIFDAVFSLEIDESSEVVETDRGFHIFLVEQRFVEKSQDHTKLSDEVREILGKQKLQTRMQTFFTTEIFKQHSVDKKI